MLDRKRLNAVLAVLAVVVLVGSCAVYAYTLVPKGDTAKVVINGKDFAWDDVFEQHQLINFTGNSVSYQGVKLSDLVNESGVASPESHQYKIAGSDGYTKTVSWANMEGGFLVRAESKAAFPGLTRSFWVKNVITIEAV